ncbi:MAG: ribosome small subunit-dependent GTPase A, partial [Thermoplasmatota archaeon]
KAGAGIRGLKRYFKKGITAVLVGSSGAGKSTIINTLFGQEKQRTGDVRESDSHGRHITTHREMFVLPDGGVIIDNPGIREIQLWGEPTDIDEAFPDIANIALGCKFKDCQHISEPDCAVKEAVLKGALDGKRYDNYLKMKKEMQNLAMRADKGGEAFQRQRWKNIHKNVKHYYKYKRERE